MTKTKKKILGLALSASLIATCLTGVSVAASADTDTNTSTYTITIPSTLTVNNSGWNATDGISATGTLATGKKLVVTASSDGEFALVSGENKVNYKLAESGITETTYANATEKTSWEFTTLGETAATQPMGIVVEDYSTKPYGDYSDTVTFTAKVEDAVVETLLTTITATGKEQASYSTANVATVSFSYTTGGSSAYTATWGWWGYGWSATVNAAEGYTITKCVFYDDANRKATDSEAPFVVETTEEDKTPQVNGTPILAYTSKGITKIEVYGYAN